MLFYLFIQCYDPYALKKISTIKIYYRKIICEKKVLIFTYSYLKLDIHEQEENITTLLFFTNFTNIYLLILVIIWFFDLLLTNTIFMLGTRIMNARAFIKPTCNKFRFCLGNNIKELTHSCKEIFYFKLDICLIYNFI